MCTLQFFPEPNYVMASPRESSSDPESIPARDDLRDPDRSQQGRGEPSPKLVAPKLREHTIPCDLGSLETLPPIQSAPRSRSESAFYEQNLPSLQHLELPLDAHSPEDSGLENGGKVLSHILHAPGQPSPDSPTESRARASSPVQGNRSPLPRQDWPNRPNDAGAEYRCDFPGCTAPPFQTQYLLK